MTDFYDDWKKEFGMDTVDEWMEEDIEPSIFAGMEFETELDIQASKILVTIHDGDKQWSLEYPAEGIDKDAGKVFGDIDYSNICIDRDEIDDPVGEEFIHYMVTKRMKQEGRILSLEEKGDAFHEIEIALMDRIDDGFKLMEAE